MRYQVWGTRHQEVSAWTDLGSETRTARITERCPMMATHAPYLKPET